MQKLKYGLLNEEPKKVADRDYSYKFLSNDVKEVEMTDFKAFETEYKPLVQDGDIDMTYPDLDINPQQYNNYQSKIEQQNEKPLNFSAYPTPNIPNTQSNQQQQSNVQQQFNSQYLTNQQSQLSQNLSNTLNKETDQSKQPQSNQQSQLQPCSQTTEVSCPRCQNKQLIPTNVQGFQCFKCQSITPVNFIVYDPKVNKMLVCYNCKKYVIYQAGVSDCIQCQCGQVNKIPPGYNQPSPNSQYLQPSTYPQQQQQQSRYQQNQQQQAQPRQQQQDQFQYSLYQSSFQTNQQQQNQSQLQQYSQYSSQYQNKK